MLEASGATIEVQLEPARFALPEEAILGWVRRAATAVNAYYGCAPAPRFTLLIEATEGAGTSNGVAAPDGHAFIKIGLGVQTTVAMLAADWMLTHEMLHLAAPSVGRRWFEEGLAVYVEPLARARAGQVSERAVFKEMAESYATGLPGAGDRGLDGTDTWARAYYGGALFWFVADVEIRKATHGERGLEHGLRAIAAAGGVVGETWTVERALEVADRGAGVSILVPLAKRWRGAPVPVDLRALWKELGVELRRGEVVLHEDAPLSGVRRALVSRTP